MINKVDIIKILIGCDLPYNEYWVLAGSALVMHEVKMMTKDIDIGCTTKLFEQLMLEGHPIEYHLDGTRSLQIDMIEIFENWKVEEIENINGIPVGSLLSIRKHKVELGREKDKRDILLIDKYLFGINKK